MCGSILAYEIELLGMKKIEEKSMGVLACDRQGCENIMCDFYSHTHGYLCWECKHELENTAMTNFEAFMQSSKCTYPDKSSWQDSVNTEFKSRYEDE